MARRDPMEALAKKENLWSNLNIIAYESQEWFVQWWMPPFIWEECFKARPKKGRENLKFNTWFITPSPWFTNHKPCDKSHLPCFAPCATYAKCEACYKGALGLTIEFGFNWSNSMHWWFPWSIFFMPPLMLLKAWLNTWPN